MNSELKQLYLFKIDVFYNILQFPCYSVHALIIVIITV